MLKSTMGAVALLLAGCAGLSTALAEQVYTGFYEQGFEVEAFHPCESSETWWVTDAPELRERYGRTAQGPYERVYAVVRGEAGPEGRFGHLGAYQRELRVEEVIELRTARQGDCG